MSIEAMNWALNQRTGNPNAKSVLFILANRANHDGRCYPGIEGIAEQLELSRRTVIRQIKALEEIGLISIVRRGGDGGGRKSNLYQLHLNAKCQSVTLGQSDNGAGQSDTHDRQSDTVTPEPKEEHKERTERISHSAKTRPADFNGRKAPPDFQPPEPMVSQMVDETGLTVDEIEAATVRFRDHCFERTTFDWDGRWRNWIRTERARHPPASGAGGRRKTAYELAQEANDAS